MSQKNEKIRVGISIGDISGIGPEVIIKTFLDERMYKICTPVVFTSPKVLSFYRKLFDAQKFQFTQVKDFSNLSYNSLNVFSSWEEEIDITPGKSDEITGRCALLSLDNACAALKEGHIDVLVTAPLNKHAAGLAAPGFMGHTEYLQSYFGANDDLMFLVSDRIKVGLVTNHLPVSQVAAEVTLEKILDKVRIMYHSLQQDFGVDKPRIAVLSLNPHAGDDGSIGKEDEEVVKPSVAAAAAEFTTVFGPYAADAFFARHTYLSFDGILATYHDQGLIPFKTLAVEGTNFTAGLPVVRTSPDHGTAEDIAGKDLADPEPFRNAIFAAMDIFRNRQSFAENRANPLKRHAQKLERGM
jgi:4-hydroxythreonine-4-phosphate dehydrogenase